MNRLEAAYQLLLPSLLAIPARDARRPRVDVAAVSGALLASLPRLEPVLPALAALPGLSPQPTLELPTRILALVQAQAAHASAPPSGRAAKALLRRGATVRRLLLRSALALADFNKLPSEPIAAIRDGRGHGDRAMDLLGLSSLYKSAWPAIERHTAVPFDLVLEAARLGDEILTALGQGEQAHARASEATLMRNRAFTYFLVGYGAARKGLDFLYGREASVEILPNVFDWRRYGRRREGKVGVEAGAVGAEREKRGDEVVRED